MSKVDVSAKRARRITIPGYQADGREPSPEEDQTRIDLKPPVFDTSPTMDSPVSLDLNLVGDRWVLSRRS